MLLHPCPPSYKRDKLPVELTLFSIQILTSDNPYHEMASDLKHCTVHNLHSFKKRSIFHLISPQFIQALLQNAHEGFSAGKQGNIVDAQDHCDTFYGSFGGSITDRIRPRPMKKPSTYPYPDVDVCLVN
jgi:hypothetical protein